MQTATQTLAAQNAHHARMMQAFNVVDPSRPAIAGYPAVDWKAPIDKLGSRKGFEYAAAHFGVTFDEVLDSVRYFTATEPRIVDAGAGLIRIQADGYRKGPAGDH